MLERNTFVFDRKMPKHYSSSPSQTIATYQRNISQHCWAQHVACIWPPCYDMLGVVGSNLTIFKLEPTTPNMSQHIATWWPNAHTMLFLTMLRYAALTFCDHLAGALKNYSICVWHHSLNLWQFSLRGYIGVITFSFWLIFSPFH